jgi:hypothetical protein
MSGLKTRYRAAAVAAVLSAAFSVTASPAAAAMSTPSDAAGTHCEERDFCLYAGPNQNGRILFQRTVTVNDDGSVDTVSEAVVEPLIYPRSARLPGLPEGLSCIAVLYTEPHYEIDDREPQEAQYGYPLEVEALSELNGQSVGSINTDCG